MTGFFGLSKLTETVNNQKAVVTSEYVLGDAGFYMGQNYTAANQQTLPTATMRLIGGDDGAAMVLVGPPWHSPRLKVWRDQVLRPFFTAIGLSV